MMRSAQTVLSGALLAAGASGCIRCATPARQAVTPPAPTQVVHAALSPRFGKPGVVLANRTDVLVEYDMVTVPDSLRGVGLIRTAHEVARTVRDAYQAAYDGGDRLRTIEVRVRGAMEPNLSASTTAFPTYSAMQYAHVYRVSELEPSTP